MSIGNDEKIDDNNNCCIWKSWYEVVKGHNY